MSFGGGGGTSATGCPGGVTTLQMAATNGQGSPVCQMNFTNCNFAIITQRVFATPSAAPTSPPTTRCHHETSAPRASTMSSNSSSHENSRQSGQRPSSGLGNASTDVPRNIWDTVCRRHFNDIVHTVRVTDIRDGLYASDVLTLLDMEAIEQRLSRASETRQDTMRWLLLDVLYRREEDLDVFIDTLTSHTVKTVQLVGLKLRQELNRYRHSHDGIDTQAGDETGERSASEIVV